MATGALASAFGAAGSLASGVINAQRNAIAANHAADMLDKKETGIIRKTMDFVVDTTGDVANIATFGVSRRVANVFAGEESKLDYKALKSELKLRKTDDDPANDKTTIRERAAMLIPDSTDAEPTQDEPEM